MLQHPHSCLPAVFVYLEHFFVSLFRCNCTSPPSLCVSYSRELFCLLRRNAWKRSGAWRKKWRRRNVRRDWRRRANSWQKNRSRSACACSSCWSTSKSKVRGISTAVVCRLFSLVWTVSSSLCHSLSIDCPFFLSSSFHTTSVKFVRIFKRPDTDCCVCVSVCACVCKWVCVCANMCIWYAGMSFCWLPSVTSSWLHLKWLFKMIVIFTFMKADLYHYWHYQN